MDIVDEVETQLFHDVSTGDPTAGQIAGQSVPRFHLQRLGDPTAMPTCGAIRLTRPWMATLRFQPLCPMVHLTRLLCTACYYH